MLGHLDYGLFFRWSFQNKGKKIFGPWVNASTKNLDFPLESLELEKFEPSYIAVQVKSGSQIINSTPIEYDPNFEIQYKGMASGFIGKLQGKIVGMSLKKNGLTFFDFDFDEFKELLK